MSRAILVIDMPESCDDCDFCYYSDGIVQSCKLTLNATANCKCPLKPLPERDEVYHLHEFDAGYKVGWNDCLKAISGETQ